MNLPADACPRCDPGIPPAALATLLANASADCAGYRCPACGFRWITRWDESGWPIVRSAA